MKSLIIGALALSLLAAGVAAAQPVGPMPQGPSAMADHDRMPGDTREGWRHDREHHRHGRRVCIWRRHHQICYRRDR